MKAATTTRTPAVSAALLAVGLLAGCTGQPAGGGADTDADSGTLTVWHYESDTSAMGKAWDKAIEIFEEENPGVTVEVEKQTFEQIQKNAKIVLTGDDVPDVMEFNKGNATAGQLAAQGLIAPLTDAAAERGWDETITGSLATTAQYDADGLMGSGDWYGVPNYGEFVGVYYNKEMFEKHGLEEPTTLEEFEEVLAAFEKEGVTPLAEAGAEYPMGQLWYELVLAHGDRALVDDYQLFANDTDFHGDAMVRGTETLAEWIEAGYIDADAAGLTAEDMGVAFMDGTYPIMVSGSWWFGRLADEAQVDWGHFNFPGSELHAGSSGNLWVVPANADSPDLAEEFIDVTLRPEVQDILAQEGGLPVAGDASAIEDDRTRELTENFQEIVDADGLAFYPDWPVAGFYDVLVSELQSLINGSKDAHEVLDGLQEEYDTGKADLVGE